MGGAMLSGWLDGGLSPSNIIVIDPAIDSDLKLKLEGRGVSIFAEVDVNLRPDVFLIAVKPQLFDQVLTQLVPIVSGDCVAVSVAAGKTIRSIEDVLGKIPVVRTMPNTPALIKKGMTVGCANALVNDEQIERISFLLSAIGRFEWVEDENLIDAVTAVSGSGPAYAFYLAECLAKAGVRAGLSPDFSNILAKQTIAGAGEMLVTSADEPRKLRENVTSPNGTTAAALSVLMDKPGLEELLVEAVMKAKKRSEELS